MYEDNKCFLYLHLNILRVSAERISEGIELNIFGAETDNENSYALILALSGNNSLAFRVFRACVRSNKF